MMVGAKASCLALYRALTVGGPCGRISSARRSASPPRPMPRASLSSREAFLFSDRDYTPFSSQRKCIDRNATLCLYQYTTTSPILRRARFRVKGAHEAQVEHTRVLLRIKGRRKDASTQALYIQQLADYPQRRRRCPLQAQVRCTPCQQTPDRTSRSPLQPAPHRRSGSSSRLSPALQGPHRISDTDCPSTPRSPMTCTHD